MIESVVAVTSGKGGVLKTTLSCHLAGLAAAGGWRVALIDADPQGNAMFDLGFESDGGRNLAEAIAGHEPLSIVRDVRPGLDVACGGPALDEICHPSRSPYALEHALGDIVSRYDLIVIDSPARELWLRRMILTAARFVIVPSGVDRASRVGLPDIAASIQRARAETNAALDVLGVVAGPVMASATQVRARARARLGDLIGDDDLVCETVIRHSVTVAEQCRERGVLTTELSLDRPTAAAEGLSRDWCMLVAELLRRFNAEVGRPVATTLPVNATPAGAA